MIFFQICPQQYLLSHVLCLQCDVGICHWVVRAMFFCFEPGQAFVTLCNFWGHIIKTPCVSILLFWDAHSWNLVSIWWGSSHQPMCKEHMEKPWDWMRREMPSHPHLSCPLLFQLQLPAAYNCMRVPETKPPSQVLPEFLNHRNDEGKWLLLF